MARCNINQCKNPALPGMKACARHAEMCRIRQRRHYAASKLAKICVISSCKNPVHGDGRRCKKHIDQKKSNYRVKADAALAGTGLCIVPGCKCKPVPGTVQCQTHLESCATRSSRRYHGAKLAGICTAHGCRRKPAPGLTQCRKHLDEGIARYNAKTKQSAG